MSKAQLIELDKRDIGLIESDNIHTNGQDNNYPERIKRVVNNSVNAKACATVLSDFLVALGFNLDNDLIVNKSKGLTLFDNLISACEDVSIQKGFWIHVNYNLDATERTIDILPYERCRASKRDDLGYNGLVYYNEFWDEKTTTNWSFSKVKKSKNKFFYPFNDNIDVINDQRRRDWKIQNPKKEIDLNDTDSLIKGYRGQVLFINLEPRQIYPLSIFDAAYNAADTEYRVSQLVNNKVRTGFMDATLIAVRDNEGQDENAINEEQVKTLLGSDNQSNIIYTEVKIDAGQKLEDAVHVESLNSTLDKDLLESVLDMSKKEILTACLQFPSVLVESGDGALFGANSETLDNAKDFFNTKTERLRKVIANGFNRALGRKDLEIIPLEVKTRTTTSESE